MSVTLSMSKIDELRTAMKEAGLVRLLSANKNDPIKALLSYLRKNKTKDTVEEKKAKRSKSNDDSQKKKSRVSKDENQKKKYSVISVNGKEYPHKTAYNATSADVIASKVAKNIIKKNKIDKSTNFTFCLRSEKGTLPIKFSHDDGLVKKIN